LRETDPENPEIEKACAMATVDSTLSELGIDSVRALEVAGYIEDKLGTSFPDDELALVSSVQGFVKLIQRNAPVAAQATAS
jgi:acyl carrier protein